MVILGIDPGTARVGYGVIARTGSIFSHIDSGLVPIKTKGEGERLLEIERFTNSLLKKYRPKIVGVEKIFFSKNVKTAISVAHARGVIIATIAKEKSVRLCEMSPSEIKSAITGDGGASKSGIARMVEHTLKIPQKNVVDDVSDALAIAIAASFLWG